MILEELVFRTAVINILFGLEFPTVAIVVIAISVFALNHVQWGLFALIQRCLADAFLFSSIFCLIIIY